MKKSREEILKAIEQTLAAISPDARIILFGSQARGEARYGSDRDLLVILDKARIELSDFDSVSYPIFELTKTEWTKRSFTQFYKNVEKEGIVL